ncbi:MAG: FAD:protein FMN transferase [Candidatus Omnitrophica bacterium]|nr:FAD:protein FMN transferase [Candidatus Omnitrophota bacterium]
MTYGRIALFCLVLSLSGIALPYPRYQSISRSETVLGTVVRITLPETPGTKEALSGAFDLIQSLEKVFSVHQSDSELSRINRLHGGRLSPAMKDLIKRALSISQLSSGAFDPTCGALVSLYRKAEKTRRAPRESEIIKAKESVGWEKLRVEGDHLSMPAGMKLDLGGIAKGYIVDQVVRMLRVSGFSHGLVDGGGDIFCWGFNPEGYPWQVGIQNPWKASNILAILSLSDRGIATSGDYQRYLMIRGKKYGHIVDPRTGRTVQGFPTSVTVVASDCATADGLATACFVLGREQGMQLLRNLDGVEGMIIDQDGQKVTTPGWAKFLLKSVR